MAKFTKREVAAWDAKSDETLARMWIDMFVNPAYRVQTGRNKGQLRLTTLKLSDAVLAAAQRRGLSLPCENETLTEWTARIERNKLYGDI